MTVEQGVRFLAGALILISLALGHLYSRKKWAE